MIADALEFTRKELTLHLDVHQDQVTINSARKLVEDATTPGAYISLINVQEETALKNSPHVTHELGHARYREPPVYLNLYLLFAFEFVNYATSLSYLSKTIEVFQHQRRFDAGHSLANFPTTIEKLTFELVNMTFEELNNLWGMLGGAYFPSVVYKVRLLKVQRDVSVPATEITTIQLETVVS